jgi:hypothetical protein
VVLASLVTHLAAPNLEIVEGRPALSALLTGLVLVGLVSLVASMCFPEQCRNSSQIALCPCNGGGCRGGYFPPGGAAVGVPFFFFFRIAISLSRCLVFVFFLTVFPISCEHITQQAGEFMFFIMIALLVYFTMVGVIRAVSELTAIEMFESGVYASGPFFIPSQPPQKNFWGISFTLLP